MSCHSIVAQVVTIRGATADGRLPNSHHVLGEHRDIKDLQAHLACIWAPAPAAAASVAMSPFGFVHTAVTAPVRHPEALHNAARRCRIRSVACTDQTSVGNIGILPGQRCKVAGQVWVQLQQ